MNIYINIYIYILNVCYLLPLGSYAFQHSFHSLFEKNTTTKLSTYNKFPVYFWKRQFYIFKEHNIPSDRAFHVKMNYFLPSQVHFYWYRSHAP